MVGIWIATFTGVLVQVHDHVSSNQRLCFDFFSVCACVCVFVFVFVCVHVCVCLNLFVCVRGCVSVSVLHWRCCVF